MTRRETMVCWRCGALQSGDEWAVTAATPDDCLDHEAVPARKVPGWDALNLVITSERGQA